MPTEHSPVAHPDAIVLVGDARFTILTPALIRMEYVLGAERTADAFEDRASQAFINRRLDVPKFRRSVDMGALTIETDELTLRWRIGSAFNAENLSITFRLGSNDVTWTPDAPDTGNLRGTTRTLDGISGSCPLEPGLLSRDGWTLVDDSAKPLFDGSDWNWMAPRPDPDTNIDWYFFAYGHDYARLLYDYTKIAGRIPLPPLYIFGSWWSRYWPYTDQQFKDLVAEFDEHSVPLDVLVLDMDWHLTGWTGYTWDPQYFPDPEAFLSWCHEKGLRTTLNLHPADGVGKHEAQFKAMAGALRAKRSDYRIPFDCTSKSFMRAYFDLLHRPLEEMGVDFWWMDWQQGTETKINGLDPLWWLNHLHWEDMVSNTDRAENRPIIFSRWGGLGNHRYPIGFSGDTFNDWASLAFQPYFTATAGNVGYAYWSHDIGGHQPGPVEDELYVRWVQYAIFSPVLRTHAGRNPAAERRIWTFRDDAYRAMRDAFHWRYRLLPYIYTACRKTYDTALPLCRPLYYHWPDVEESYAFEDEYLFGDDLLVAPVVEPANESSSLASTDVWFPTGCDWIHWFTGKNHRGGTRERLLSTINEIPVFARAGGIIPHAPDMMRTGETSLDPLTLHVFPGESGSTRLYEDDTLTQGYLSGACAWTNIDHQTTDDGNTRIIIHPAEGSYEGSLDTRAVEIRHRDSWPPASVRINGEVVERLAGPAVTDQQGWWYDEQEFSICIRSHRQSARETIQFDVQRALPSDADDAIREGLRGQLTLLEDIADLLDSDTPSPVREATVIRQFASRDPERAVEAARELQRNWWSLVESVDGCDHPERPRALAKLLGLVTHLDVAASETGVLTALAEIDFAPRFGTPHDISVEASFESSAEWRLEPHSLSPGVKRTLAEQCSLAAALHQVGDELSTGLLTLGVDIVAGPLSIRLDSHKHFCPSVNVWAIAGPFEAPFDDDQLKEPLAPDTAFTQDYPRLPRLTKRWRAWRRADSAARRQPSDEFLVDLQRVFGAEKDEPIENAWCYAACTIESLDEREALLVFGSDDSIMIMLNAEQVFHRHIQRGYSAREESQAVRLRKGTNTLLLKIGNATLGWAFALHVDTPDGKPMTDLRFALPELP